MNLLEETIAALELHNKSKDDVKFCQSKMGWFSWEEFEAVARVCEYDAGFGAQEIASDLVIVGSDFWLERDEYDGSEDWAFRVAPVRSEIKIVPAKFNGGRWSTHREIEGLKK